MEKQKTNSPTVYVIAGCNGAGKTTFATQFLPDYVSCREFVNADLIAAGLSPFRPETQNAKAGRLLLERINELADDRVDFGFETTLAGRTYLKILTDMKRNGYRVKLYFLWLPSVEMAIDRVALRVSQGGHNIATVDIRRRYSVGLQNLFGFYHSILDGWWLYDASSMPPLLIASEEQQKLTVRDEQLFTQIEDQAKGNRGKKT